MKPRDKTSQKLKERFDQLGDMDSNVVRKELRAARKAAKKHMSKHNRILDKQETQELLSDSSDME